MSPPKIHAYLPVKLPGAFIQPLCMPSLPSGCFSCPHILSELGLILFPTCNGFPAFLYQSFAVLISILYFHSVGLHVVCRGSSGIGRITLKVIVPHMVCLYLGRWPCHFEKDIHPMVRKGKGSYAGLL